jgi:hypothetical protein
LYLAQSSKLIALDWMNTSDAALQSPDMEMRSGEIDLIPFQINCLSDAQAMASH